jgi:hypothetical protein
MNSMTVIHPPHISGSRLLLHIGNMNRCAYLKTGSSPVSPSPAPTSCLLFGIQYWYCSPLCAVLEGNISGLLALQVVPIYFTDCSLSTFLYSSCPSQNTAAYSFDCPKRINTYTFFNVELCTSVNQSVVYNHITVNYHTSLCCN